MCCIIEHVKQNVSSHNLVANKSIILRLGCIFFSIKHGLFLSLGTFGTNLSRILLSVQYGLLTEHEVKVAGYVLFLHSLSQYLATLTEQAWSIKDILIWLRITIHVYVICWLGDLS